MTQQDRERFIRVFSKRERLTDAQTRVLIRLAKRAFKAGENACIRNSEHARRMVDLSYEDFTEFANLLGYKVSWPGLYPVLTDKNGYSIHLPSVD